MVFQGYKHWKTAYVLGWGGYCHTNMLTVKKNKIMHCMEGIQLNLQEDYKNVKLKTRQQQQQQIGSQSI